MGRPLRTAVRAVDARRYNRAVSARSETTSKASTWLSRLDWRWLGLLLFLPALSRWWWSGLPAGDDHYIHVYRAVELDWALSQGANYPRWAADLVFGFGYPLFSVHGPAAHYVIVGLHRLGLSVVQATLASFALADVVGGLGAYTLGRRLFGIRGGVLTALAAVYAPYSLLFLQRGALQEMFGLALLPWLLWSILDLFERPGAWTVARTAILFALFPFTHNPSTAVASACAVFMIVLLSVNAPRGRRLRPALFSAGALALGLALCAWVWLPIAFEISAIHIDRAYSPPLLDYHFQFVRIGELLTWPKAYDPYLLNFAVPHAVGWPQLLLAGLALSRLPRRPAPLRFLLIAAAFAAVALAALTLPDSVWIWDHLPGLRLIQFPWRLLGPGSLLLAVVCGSLVADSPSSVRPNPRSAWVIVAAAAALTVYGLPWTYVPLDPSVSANPSLIEIQDRERRTLTIGTTTAGEYLPIWVQQLPDATTLQAAYAAGGPIKRLDRASLPATTLVVSEEAAYTRQQVVLDSPVAFTAVFNVFYYPGWWATVNGVDVALTPTTPTGLISLPVPAGRSTIVLDFGSTAPRDVGGAITAVSLLAWLALAVRGLASGRSRPISKDPDGVTLPAWGWAAAAAVALAVLGLRAVSQTVDTPFVRLRAPDGAAPSAQQPTVLDFGEALRLSGFTASTSTVAADQPLELTLYWRPILPERDDYSVQVTLRDAAGAFFAQSDTQNPGNRPTRLWPFESYAADAHTLKPYAATPPGTYAIMAMVYRQKDGQPVSGPTQIGTVTVTCPTQAQIDTRRQSLDIAFGPIDLTQVDAPATTAGVGDLLRVTAYWDARQQTDVDLLARIRLLDAQGRVLTSADLPPVRADYPTSAWEPGCPVRGALGLRVPADAATGRYTVDIQLTQGDTVLNTPVVVGSVDVRAPDRTFDAMPVDHAVGARFGDVAELVGWTESEGVLSLVWHALGASERPLVVFVHALDDSDAIIGQVDAQPVGGARPTTSWLAGEFIRDPYRLPLSTTPVRYRVGLYDADTGARLTTTSGEDFVILMP